jgi:hypothetical protein
MRTVVELSTVECFTRGQQLDLEKRYQHLVGIVLVRMSIISSEVDCKQPTVSISFSICQALSRASVVFSFMYVWTGGFVSCILRTSLDVHTNAVHRAQSEFARLGTEHLQILLSKCVVCALEPSCGSFVAALCQAVFAHLIQEVCEGLCRAWSECAGELLAFGVHVLRRIHALLTPCLMGLVSQNLTGGRVDVM